MSYYKAVGTAPAAPAAAGPMSVNLCIFLFFQTAQIGFLGTTNHCNVEIYHFLCSWDVSRLTGLVTGRLLLKIRNHFLRYLAAILS